MYIKTVKLLAIVGIMLFVVSCSSSKATQAVPVPAASQGQSSQAQANNPSDIQGGITMREGYDQAILKALEWSSSAVLSEVSQTPINQEGKSSSWIYYFVDDTLKSAADRSMGFYVIVGENGVTEAKPGNIPVSNNMLQAYVSDLQIDARQALTACDQIGGAELRTANPALGMDAWLRMYDYQAQNGMPQPSSKNISWSINYREPAKAQTMSCEVDGYTGKVYSMNKALSVDPSAKPITAKTGFQAALKKAQEWNPAATLLSVMVEFPAQDRTGPIDGVSRYWRYKFIVAPAPSGVDYQPSYDVVVGDSGLMSFQAGYTYADYATYGSQADWTIDSDEAFRLSEENGGKAYRDSHSDGQYGMVLNFGFYPIDELNTTKNVRWETGYSSESDFENELQFQIDGTNGELVSQP